jgi:hypothetical protein
MNSILNNVFAAIRTTPSLLRQKLPDMIEKLHSQGNSDAQGTGNMPTPQEASFAAVLESHGVQFQPNDTASSSIPGFFYLYQLNGSQKSIDFRVIQTDGTKLLATVDFDLKHTTGETFFLNDGWFHENVVYIVTWNRKTSLKGKKKTTEAATFIGLGQDIPTAEENEGMKTILALKKEINTKYKKIGSLQIYVRFANQYSCARFTPEYTETLYANVLHQLSSSSSSSPSSVAASTT